MAVFERSVDWQLVLRKGKHVWRGQGREEKTCIVGEEGVG